MEGSQAAVGMTSEEEKEEDVAPFDVCVVLPTKVDKHKHKKQKEKDDGLVEVDKDDDDDESVEDFESGPPGKTKSFRRLISRMEEAGLEYESYFSIQHDEVYVKIRCPKKRLFEQADTIDFQCRFDEKRLSQALARGFPEHGIKPIVIGNECKGNAISKYRPCEYIYGKFDTCDELVQSLYERPKDSDSPFRSMHRIKVISDILQGPRRLSGCEIPLAKRIHQKKFLAYLPLHNPKGRSEVEQLWRSVSWYRPDRYPYNRFRSYFGESISLYFTFIGFLSEWYSYLAVVGSIAYIIVRSVGYDNGPTAGVVRAVYGCILTIWSALFSVEWRSTQSKIALRWGMVGFESNESDRPQFKGTVIPSPIDGSPEVYYPNSARRNQVIFGAFISGLVVIADLVFIFAVHEYRDRGAANGDQNRATIASFISAIGILIFKFVYGIIARKLTSAENWRTETQYADKLTTKLFVFNFINSYFALFTTLFAASRQTCATPLQCLNVLEQNLQTIFLISLLSDVLTSTLLPYLLRQYNVCMEGGSSKAMSGPEWEYVLLEFDETIDIIQAYMAATTSFGYVALFSAAAPIVPLYAALSEAILLRLEGLKYLVAYRRIEPRGAQDIGRFERFIALQGVLSAISTAGIVIYLSPPFQHIVLPRRRYVFVISAAIAIVVQLLIRFFGAGNDEDIQLQLKRQEFIRSKVVDKVADDEEIIQSRPSSSKQPDYSIEDKDPSDRYYNDIAEVIADSRVRVHKRRPIKHKPHRGDLEEYARNSLMDQESTEPA